MGRTAKSNGLEGVGELLPMKEKTAQITLTVPVSIKREYERLIEVYATRQPPTNIRDSATSSFIRLIQNWSGMLNGEPP